MWWNLGRSYEEIEQFRGLAGRDERFGRVEGYEDRQRLPASGGRT